MPSQYLINDYLNDLKRAIQSKKLDSILSINPVKATSHMAQLQTSLQSLSDKQIMQEIENSKLFNNDWITFENLVHKYLIFVRDFNPWSLLESIDLLIDFYECLSISLNNLQFNSNLLSLVMQTTKTIVPLTKLVDTKLMKVNNRTNDFPRLSYVSTLLLKTLNNLRSDPDLNIPSNKYKISVLVYVTVTLCNTYIEIDSAMLCNNVFANVNILQLDKSLISRKLLVQYRFILGKFYLLQSNFNLAYHHFDWCFKNCPSNVSLDMLIKICKYLVPCGLVVGKVANLNYLKTKLQNNKVGLILIELYEPLIYYYKQGDLFHFTQTVESNEDYFLHLGILIGFLQRVRILVIRNLLLKVYKKTGTLKFNSVKTSLNLSFNQAETYTKYGVSSRWFYLISDKPEIADDLVDNVLIALFDSNLIKGKLTASRSVVLRKLDAFPNIHEIYKVKYPKNPKESWLD